MRPTNLLNIAQAIFEGGLPYPQMEGRKTPNLPQQGYRILKLEHINDDLHPCTFTKAVAWTGFSKKET